jgi:hypothetical protein
MRACEVCGAEVHGGRTVTCSDRCRAERWRRRQDRSREARDRDIAEALAAQIRCLGFKVKLESAEPIE